MPTSLRTTSLGIATVVAALAGAAKAFLDDDTLTTVDIPTLIAAITAGVGLIFSRDNRVSDQAAGVRPEVNPESLTIRTDA